MRFLLLGGTGHTGERLARRLMAAGYGVRVLSRRDPRRDAVLRGLLEAGAEHALGDATRRWTVLESLDGCEALLSCAHIRYADACVAACETVGVRRYIQMSSTRRFTRFPCTSQREVIRGESIIERSHLDYTILRPTMIFGGKRDENVTRLVEWFRRHRWFPMFGSGANLVQPIYVEDLLDAFITALEQPEKTARRVYTLAGPEPVSYRQLLTETAQACGVRRPILIPIPLKLALLGARVAPFLAKRGLTREQIQRFAEDKTADISEARRDLGFQPRPFAEAIRLKAAGKAETE